MKPHRLVATAMLALLSAGIPGRAAVPPARIVSLVPAVTEMIFAIGDGSRLVGVSNYDRFPPEVSRFERVGGLLDPDNERILALKPDLVVVYATQAELKQRLERASVPYFSYEHHGLSDIADTIRAVGARLGSAAAAERVASDLEGSIAEVRRATMSLDHPRVLLVFGREPGTVRNVDASGGYGFLHDMLVVAGGTNVFADVARQSVRAGTELILASRPEVIIELHYGERRDDLEASLSAWNVLSSVPAVRDRRVHALVGDEFVIPGPRVIDAIRQLAEILHPGAVR